MRIRINNIIKYCITFSCICIFSFSFSQRQLVPSKDSILRKQVIEYSKLAKSLQSKQVDSALYYSEKGFKIAKQLNYDFGVGENVAVLGDIHITNNKLDNAEKYYLIARKHFNKSKYSFDYSQINMILGNICIAQNRYYDGLMFYQECLDSSLVNNYENLLPHVYNNLGVLHMGIYEYESAANYFDNAYQIFTIQNDTYNIGFSFLNLAKIDVINGNSAESIKGYFNALKIFSEKEDWVNVASVYSLISSVYYDDKDFENANVYIEMALSIIDKNQNTFEGPSSLILSNIYLIAAKINAEYNKMTKSMHFAKKSFSLSTLNSYKENIAEDAELISAIFDLNNQPDSALFLSIYYSYYKRSFLNNRDNTSYILKEIKELQVSKKMNIPEDVRVQAFMLSSEVEMLQYIDSKNFQEAINLLKQNKKYLSKHSSYIKKYYLLINYYCIGLAHFHLKEFSQALNYTKKNIDNFNDSIRLDYYMYNLTLNFIIHIELDNSSIYKYLNSTYKRAIKKHGLQDSEEGIYATFFEQIVKKANPTKDLYLKTYKSLKHSVQIAIKELMTYI